MGCRERGEHREASFDEGGDGRLGVRASCSETRPSEKLVGTAARAGDFGRHRSERVAAPTELRTGSSGSNKQPLDVSGRPRIASVQVVGSSCRR